MVGEESGLSLQLAYRKGKQLRFDLQKDLALLRQARQHVMAVFVRASPALEEVLTELLHFDMERFAGVTKKAVKDKLKCASPDAM